MTAEGAPSIRAHVASLPTSPYRYDASADAWTVAPVARQVLGLEPDAPLDVARLLDLLPDVEREQVARFVFDAIRGRVPFSTLQHVLRPDGEVREVLVVGEGTYEGETLVAVHGHVVDVGALGADRADERIDRAVAEVVANRATIEQAKGALMLAFCVDEETAFRMLCGYSQRRNAKLRDVAAFITDAVADPHFAHPDHPVESLVDVVTMLHDDRTHLRSAPATARPTSA